MLVDSRTVDEYAEIYSHENVGIAGIKAIERKKRDAERSADRTSGI